ncbi:uncharacterized protein LOC100205019 isoform X2 [Hydra vulgaris]|uniref:uncharacterized protein LOC100205019 isoform X2 n=1 Tax=Hydra vulgaris TaxID=6087 RepID=UPI001F5F4CB0|nr:N-geranyl-L-glutamate oxidase-like isoform X2 [Hydra vulgaris]XP_047145246.1 N-geranyl-L-glutamate oxidase-like isoform X2 [Hydra vulgaris]
MYSIYIAIIIVPLVFFVAVFFKRFCHQFRLLPSPKESLITCHYSYFDVHDHVNTLLNFGKEFKDYGLYTINTLIGPRQVHLLLPHFIKTVIADGKFFQRSPVFKAVFPLVGNSMIVSNYEDHHWQRKLFNQAFTSQQLKRYFLAFTLHTDLLMKLWSCTCDKENGTNLNVWSDLSNLSFDIIGDVGFGYQFNTITSHSGNAFTKALRSYINLRFNSSVVHNVLIAYFPFLMRFLSKFGNLNKAEQVIYNTLNMLIDKRKKEIENGLVKEEKDFLSIVLKDQQQEKSKLTNDLIRDNLMTLLIAGHETTSTAMLWCLYTLGTNLDVQNKLREEIKKNVFDIKSILREEVLSIKYLDCVVKETLRMHPPASFISRKNKTETKLGDYDLPAGTFLRISINNVHMNESVYPDPYLFKPERFMTDKYPMKTSNNH